MVGPARVGRKAEIATVATGGDLSGVGAGCDERFEFAFDVLLEGFERLRGQGWTSRRG